MYKNPPKIVKQSSNWTCWAAGTESYLDKVPYSGRPKQKDLVDQYATHANGGLEPTGHAPYDFETLAADFSLQYRVVAGGRFDPEFVDNKLKRGHVLLVYNMSPSVSHTHVVYGVGRPSGKGKMISVMDPWIGGYKNHPISHYTARAAIIIAWQ